MRRLGVHGAHCTGTVLRNPGADILLPSENEWYKAAYWHPGTQGFFAFPAGSNTPTACAGPGPTANTANCGFAVGGVTDVGAYTGSASPYGTFDQGGNVWEWNESIVAGSSRGIRGGSWNFIVAGVLAASFPFSDFPSFESAGVGFRVASLVPEPDASPLAMIVLAGLAARRRR